MTSAAVTFLTLGSAPEKLWHEFLTSYFDGAAHAVNGSSVTFPSVRVGFGVNDLSLALEGVGITVTSRTVKRRSFLDDGSEVALTGARQQKCYDKVEWAFWIRARVGQSAAGNEEFQVRQALDLLRGLLSDNGAVWGLAQKGILRLDPGKEEPVPGAVGMCRRLLVGGQVHYSV
jgi:hypothetical protein